MVSVNTHNLEHKKRIGAFYTPDVLTQILTDWAIDDVSDTVLEPSFGGCGFLAATRNRLTNLGCLTPQDQIFGCDIDEQAFQSLTTLFLNQPTDKNHFIQKDFMATVMGVDWLEPFNVSVGNPPYIASSSILASQRNEYSVRWQKKLGAKISKKSSLWVHFLFQAFSFLKEGGRLAWVLPGSFLQADYASTVRDFIAANFEQTICILLQERMFRSEGTEEETVILLAKNKSQFFDLGDKRPSIAFADARSMAEIQSVIQKWEAGSWTGQSISDRPAYLYAHTDTVELFEQLKAHPSVKFLGDVLKVNIGIVTGANPFFVLSNKCLSEAGLLPEDARPILAKFRAAKGLSFQSSDHQSDLNDGGRGHLIHVETLPAADTRLFQYIDSFPKDLLRTISTFKSRQNWYSPDDMRIPDAFLSVMNHDGPRIVLNEMKVNCTNTIHRGYFLEQIKPQKQKLIAISMMTSLSQLSAEFVGRRYGSGVLKHEPSEMKKIVLCIPEGFSAKEINRTFKKVDKALREGLRDQAMKMADAFILPTICNSPEQVSEILSSALSDNRKRRQRSWRQSGSQPV